MNNNAIPDATAAHVLAIATYIPKRELSPLSKLTVITTDDVVNSETKNTFVKVEYGFACVASISLHRYIKLNK